MAGYTKLHSGILDSSIWSEDVYTRVVWVAMLAKADADGRVIAAPSRMVEIANVPQSKFDRAIVKLTSPDPESKTPENEGRRLIPIQGGWQILNYKMYRETRDEDERREYMREYMRKYRKNKDVNTVNNCKQQLAQAEAEAEALIHPLPPQGDGFEAFWKLYPKKVGKGAAKKAWAKLKPDETLVKAIMEGLDSYRETEEWMYPREGGRYIPHPATWLNQERWKDEVKPCFQDPTDEEIEAINKRYQARKTEYGGSSGDVGHD